jgi:hypothetical protein
MATSVRLVSPSPVRPSRTRRNLTPSEARAYLEELSTSGLKPSQFAKRKGVSKQCLSYWSTKLGIPLRLAPTAAPRAFIPVQITGTPPPAVRPTAPAPFAIGLRDGRTLRVPADFERVALTQLVATLQEVGAW